MIPLVLLPGMMCDARLFGPQTGTLSGRVPLMTMPLGGHDTMAALAAGVLSSAPPRFAVAGLSMGGIVAMEILRQAPERVVGLALMDTSPLAEPETAKARRTHQIATVEAGGLRDVMRDEMKPCYVTDGPRRDAILTLCMDMATDLGATVFVRQSRALRDRYDQTETLRSFSRPALVLCGREDRLCPVERHRLMHGMMAESTLEIIEDAGHLPTLEQPEKTTAALYRWLEAL